MWDFNDGLRLEGVGTSVISNVIYNMIYKPLINITITTKWILITVCAGERLSLIFYLRTAIPRKDHLVHVRCVERIVRRAKLSWHTNFGAGGAYQGYVAAPMTLSHTNNPSRLRPFTLLCLRNFVFLLRIAKQTENLHIILGGNYIG